MSLINMSITRITAARRQCHQRSTHHDGGVLLLMVLITISYSTQFGGAARVFVSSTSGDDIIGTGSNGAPYASIRRALTMIGSTSSTPSTNDIDVAAGVYSGWSNTDLDLVSLLSPLGAPAAVTLTCQGVDGTCIINAQTAQRFATVNCSYPTNFGGNSTGGVSCVTLSMIGINVIGGTIRTGGCISVTNATLSVTRATFSNAPLNCLWISASSVTLSSMIISDNGGTGTVAGGGIHVSGREEAMSYVTISNTGFIRNYAQSQGGALALIRGGTLLASTVSYLTLTIDRCRFVQNQALGSGAVFVLTMAKLDVTNTLFDTNYATGAGLVSWMNIVWTTWYNNTFINNFGRSTGMLYFQVGDAIIDTCYFGNNTGTVGSVMQMFAGTQTVRNSQFVGNTATSGTIDSGKGNPRPVFTITNSMFINNIGTVAGAGINLQSASIVKNITFIGNKGVTGTCLLVALGGAVIEDITFDDNVASSQGAVVSINYATAGNTNFNNLLFRGNRAPSGGVVSSVIGTGIWQNCTFINNVASSLAGGGAVVVLDGLHQFYGSSFINNSAPVGGAIMVTGGQLNMYNCIFDNNYAISSGGAYMRTLVVVATLPQLFSNCLFVNNRAAQGGAMASLIGSIIMNDCQFINNSAIQGGGLAIEGGQGRMSGSYFSGNTASTNGGAVIHQDGTLIISNNTVFEYNSATLQGGAIGLLSTAGSSPVVIINRVIVNHCRAAAGGAFSFTGGQVRLIDVECHNNIAIGSLSIEAAGGAIDVKDASNVIIVNGHFHDNEAMAIGGAINHPTKSSSLTLTNCEILNNHAPLGGGIAFAGPFTATRTVMTNNSAARGGAMYGKVCPSPLLSQVIFVENKASRAGGAFHWAFPVPLCDAICAPINPSTGPLSPFTLSQGHTFDCTFQNNSGLVGSSLSSEAHHMVAVSTEAASSIATATPTNDTTGLPSSISALDGTLTVQVRVLNYYGELMECIDGYIESVLVVITSDAGVRISGRPLESVIGGIATFSALKFAPDTTATIPIDGLQLPSIARSQTSLTIVARPPLQFDIIAPLKLTDVVLSGDAIKSDYSGGSVVLAVLVAVVGCWTSMIFIEEAVFCMQGQRKSHVPYTFVASISLGLCGVWGAYVMELGALTFLSANVTMELSPSIVLSSAPLAIFLVWLSIELYVREFGRRSARIQRTPRAEFTYGGADNGAQSKADSKDRQVAAVASVEAQSLVVHSADAANGPATKSSSPAATPKNISGTPKAAKYTSTKKPTAVKEYSAVIRMLRDGLMPRVMAANVIMGILQASMTLVLLTSIRWTTTLQLNSGNIIGSIFIGALLSHISFWLMFNLNVARFVVPFSITLCTLSVHHTLMDGNTYVYSPERTWSTSTWSPSSYTIIVTSITAVMCFLFTGIQFSRMQLSRNALHIILNKAKSQISILEGSLSASTKLVTTLEKTNADYSRMLELIAYCGPSYTHHSVALAFAKEKQSLKGNKDAVKDGSGGAATGASATPTAGTAASSNGTLAAPSLLPGYQPAIHSDTSFLLTLEKVEEATKDPTAVVAKLDAFGGDLELRDIVKNAVTLEIFKHFMMSEHAAESLSLYLDIQRYKMLGTKDSRQAMATRMVVEYLEDKSPQEVNVGQATRMQVNRIAAAKTWPINLFDSVEKAVYSLMTMDTLVRFRKTKDYVTCALLLGTFGSLQLERGLVDAPTAPAPPLEDSVIRGHGTGARESSIIAPLSVNTSRYTELASTELTPLSQPRHIGAAVTPGGGGYDASGYIAPSPKGSLMTPTTALRSTTYTGSLLAADATRPIGTSSSPVNTIHDRVIGSIPPGGSNVTTSGSGTISSHLVTGTSTILLTQPPTPRMSSRINPTSSIASSRTPQSQHQQELLPGELTSS